VIIVDLFGLEVFGRHGVTDEERERGQTFLFDVQFEVSDAALSDRLEDAVDYNEVAACVREVSERHTYSLLEALAAAVADEIVARLGVARVRVRVRKRDVQPAGLEVEFTGATVQRPARTRAFVGLGSNLGDREANLRAASTKLGDMPRTTVASVSEFRDTEPVGVRDQPRFLNGAVALETELPPRTLLECLLAIERSLGRDRAGVPPGGPRTIDLDLLLYGAARIDEPGLQVPHPRLCERAFVLEPLAELDPALQVPGEGPVEALLAKLDSRP
jgi:2-amino-4-hydroxy-6-hydroxymethyldihydropteridine diphosphokinase/dihydroneopterin aldolase